MKGALHELSPRTLLALATVCVVWGSTYLAIRISLESFPPLLMSGVRFLIAGGVMYAVLRLRGAKAPTAKEWRGAACTGVLFLGVGNGAVCIAEEHVSSSVAAVLCAAMPLWAVVFARFFGERSSAGELAGVLLGFAGVGVLNLGGDLRGRLLGVACAIGGPMAWGLGTVIARRVALPKGAMSTAAQMLTASAAMLIVGLARGERVTAAPRARAVLAVLYLIVFGSMLAFTAFGYVTQRARPAIATSYAYVNPLVALVLGSALGGEHVGLATVAGAGIILAGVGLLSRAKSAPARGASLEVERAASAPDIPLHGARDS